MARKVKLTITLTTQFRLTNINIHWNLSVMNFRGLSKNVHVSRNFTLTVASCISVIMPGNFKAVCIKQVFHFNSGNINKVPLYNAWRFQSG